MRKEIRYDRWFVIDTTNGTVAIPQDYIGKTLQIIEKLYMQWEHSEDEYMYDRICSGQSAYDPTVSMGLKVFKAGYIACKNNK